MIPLHTFLLYCALYTVAALSALMEPTDRICPIVHVRKQDEEPIKELLAPMPNVDLTGIRSDTDRGDIVELNYEDQNRRIERQTGFMSPILPQDVEFALDAFGGRGTVHAPGITPSAGRVTLRG